ncbi:MAG: DUF3795 domain-containing protein [Promethearchaeota archaeon]|nr:MAG: DUF3795 domain-containing protein [Candidatus Lokiarchaeota archaeon]
MHFKKSKVYIDKTFGPSQWGSYKVVEAKKELLAPCGLYCGVCRIYQAHQDNNLEFKKEILPTLHDFGVKSVDDIACTGCLSDGVIFHFCRTCPIKDCIKDKNFEGCYQCDDFPCTIITNWPDSLDQKVMLRAIPTWHNIGTVKWVEAEEKRYQCPKCSTLLFHGARSCKKCNFRVDLD